MTRRSVVWLLICALGYPLAIGCNSNDGEPVATGRTYVPIDDDEPASGPTAAPAEQPPVQGSGDLDLSRPASGAGDAISSPSSDRSADPVAGSPGAGSPGAGSPGAASTGGAPRSDASAPGAAAAGQTPAPATNPSPQDPAAASNDGTPGNAADVAQPELITMASYKPPQDATPRQLIDHLEKLNRASPRSKTQQEQFVEAQELLAGRVETAERLLTHKESSVEQQQLGVDIKMDSLHRLRALGIPQAMKHLRDFASALKSHPTPQLAKKGRLVYLGLSAGDLDTPGAGDPDWIAEEIIAILGSEPLDAETFHMTHEAAGQLLRIQHPQGSRCASAVLDRFKDHEDPEIKPYIAAFREEAAIAKFKLGEKLQAVMEGKPNAAQTLTAAVDEVAKLPTRGRNTVAILAECAQYMEISGNYEEAGKIYSAIRASYANYEDEQLRKVVASTVDNATKRLALIGKPLAISGDTVSGTPLNWEDYKGKVVLVDFWATWCVPCLQEIPNIQKNYEKYREKGFEVIGYNVDEEPGAVKKFFDLQELPWQTVLGKDPEKRGFGIDPFPNSLGIDAIPFVVLIGRDGNVLAIHVRGEDLGRRLAELFPDESPAPETPSTEPKPE